jgi:hypothetical protein
VAFNLTMACSTMVFMSVMGLALPVAGPQNAPDL